MIAAWSIWICLAISARAKDVRVAQQLGMLASLPTVAVTSLIAFGVLGHGVVALVALLILDVLGWRIIAATFERERLIT